MYLGPAVSGVLHLGLLALALAPARPQPIISPDGGPPVEVELMSMGEYNAAIARAANAPPSVTDSATTAPETDLAMNAPPSTPAPSGVTLTAPPVSAPEAQPVPPDNNSVNAATDVPELALDSRSLQDRPISKADILPNDRVRIVTAPEAPKQPRGVIDAPNVDVDPDEPPEQEKQAEPTQDPSASVEVAEAEEPQRNGAPPPVSPLPRSKPRGSLAASSSDEKTLASPVAEAGDGPLQRNSDDGPDRAAEEAREALEKLAEAEAAAKAEDEKLRAEDARIAAADARREAEQAAEAARKAAEEFAERELAELEAAKAEAARDLAAKAAAEAEIARAAAEQKAAEQRAAEAEAARAAAEQRAARELAERELAKMQAAEEAAKALAEQRAAEEAARELAKRRAEEELAARRFADEQARKKAEAELAARQAAEEEARRLAEAELERQRAAEEEARRLAEAELERQRAAEAKAKAEAELAAQRAADEEAQRLAQAELERQRAAEAEAARREAEAELAARRAAEAEAARLADEQRKMREEMEAIRRAEAEKADEEARRQAYLKDLADQQAREQQRLAEEQARRAYEQEQAQLAAEAEAQRQYELRQQQLQQYNAQSQVGQQTDQNLTIGSGTPAPAPPADDFMAMLGGAVGTQSATSGGSRTFSQNVANQNNAAPLTPGEQQQLLNQLARCWRMMGQTTQIVTMRVSLTRDGRVSNAVPLSGSGLAVEHAFRALQDTACQPFPLPPQKYGSWQQIDIVFDPRRMTLQ